MGQNTSNSVWKPCEDLQKTFDLCHCQQRVYNKVLRLNFVIDQILIFHHNLQINSLKILQCDFLDFFSYFVSHSWGITMMKITGLSHLFKWENLHNWWLTKYFFAPLYYIDRTQSFRTSDQLFVCHGGRQKGNAVSKQRMAHWIVDAITLDYQAQGVPCPFRLRAHSTRSVATSWALARGASLTDICRAAGWATPNMFARFYSLSVELVSSCVLTLNG